MSFLLLQGSSAPSICEYRDNWSLIFPLQIRNDSLGFQKYFRLLESVYWTHFCESLRQNPVHSTYIKYLQIFNDWIFLIDWF